MPKTLLFHWKGKKKFSSQQHTNPFIFHWLGFYAISPQSPGKKNMLIPRGKINKLCAGVKHCVLKTPVLLGVGSQMVKINQADFPNAACVPRCWGSSQHRLQPDQEYLRWGPGYLHVCRCHLHQLINTNTLTHGQQGEVSYREETTVAPHTHVAPDLSFTRPAVWLLHISWLWHFLLQHRCQRLSLLLQAWQAESDRFLFIFFFLQIILA